MATAALLRATVKTGVGGAGAWYVARAVTAWRTRICAIVAGAGAALATAACGSSAPRQDRGEPHANFTVAVRAARFPAAQTLAARAHLVIAVRNAGATTIPDVAVTICNLTCAYPAPAGAGTSAQAFAAVISAPNLANSSRPVWIVNRGPGACGYSCPQGGAGAASTSYSNTWSLGRLEPGRTARFVWAVTAVSAGLHIVAWEVAAGLNGDAKAVLADGSVPHGRFTVYVSSVPVKSYVEPDGRVTTTP